MGRREIASVLDVKSIRGRSAYSNVGTTRWVVEVEIERGEIVLDDGSRWRVNPAHRILVRPWFKTMQLVVELPTAFEQPDYVLNADGTRVPAKLLGFGPLGHASPRTRRVRPRGIHAR